MKNSFLRVNGAISLENAFEYCFNKNQYELFIDKNYIRIKKIVKENKNV